MNVESLDGEVDSLVESTLEPYFFSESVVLHNNMRLVRKEQNEGNGLDIYSKAIIVDSFEDAGYENYSEIIVDDEDILKEETEGLSAHILDEEDEIDTLFDDNDNYLAQRYRNIITLSVGINDLKADGLKKILNGFGYEKIPDAEVFRQRLLSILRTVDEKNKSRLEKRIVSMRGDLQSIYNSYKSKAREIYSEERKIHGIEGEEKRLEEFSSEQIERLQESRYLDSLEVSENKFRMITKPLKIGIWDIGQWVVEYEPERYDPKIRSLNNPLVSSEETCVIDIEEGEQHYCDVGFEHPHVNQNGRPCLGNFYDEAESFWKMDMLTGFNYSIQFIKSYRKDGAYTPIERILKTFGYVDDMNIILDEIGRITKIDNGVVYIRDREYSEDELYEMGLTGERCDSETYFNDHLNSNAIRWAEEDEGQEVTIFDWRSEWGSPVPLGESEEEDEE